MPMHLWGLTTALIFNNNINTENLEDFTGFPRDVATFHFYITTNCRLALLLCQGHWYDVTFRLFAARSGSQERARKIIKWQLYGFYSKTIYYQLILFIYIYGQIGASQIYIQDINFQISVHLFFIWWLSGLIQFF